jgi:hypothetical protein
MRSVSMLDKVTIISCISGTTVINPNIVVIIPKYLITNEALLILILFEKFTKNNPKLAVRNNTPKIAKGLAVFSSPLTAKGLSKLLM